MSLVDNTGNYQVAGSKVTQRFTNQGQALLSNESYVHGPSLGMNKL